MIALALSIAALLVGPLLIHVAGRLTHTVEFLDGLVLVAISGLVFLHIVPHAMLVAGPLALAVAALGFVFPVILERGVRTSHARFVPLVAIGFVVHAFVDGAALTTDDDATSGALALAVVFHRLPDGLAIWSVVRRARSAGAAAIVLALLAAATSVGFAAGPVIVTGAASHALALIQAFVAGSVLHIVLHSSDQEHGEHDHDHHEHHRRDGTAAGVGAIVGVAIVVIVTTLHPIVRRETNELAAGVTFLALSLDAAPAVLFAMLASGAVHAFVPDALVERTGGGSRLSQALRGALVAPLVPTCSCGAVPFYRTLVRRGASVAAAIAFLVSAPELSVPALMVSSALLGRAMTIARIVAALATAVCAGVLVARIAPSRATRSRERTAAVDRRRAFIEGVSDVLEHTGPWLVVGLALAALVEPMVGADLFTALPASAQVPAFALASMPFYVCASGATPLIAILMHKGLAPGAALAFLVAGPASNVTTFGALSRIHGRRAALAYVAAVTLLAVVSGFLANATIAPIDHAALHELGHRTASRLDIACLVVVAAAFVVVVVRRGPRHLVGQVIASHRELVSEAQR